MVIFEFVVSLIIDELFAYFVSLKSDVICVCAVSIIFVGSVSASPVVMFARAGLVTVSVTFTVGFSVSLLAMFVCSLLSISVTEVAMLLRGFSLEGPPGTLPGGFLIVAIVGVNGRDVLVIVAFEMFA